MRISIQFDIFICCVILLLFRCLFVRSNEDNEGVKSEQLSYPNVSTSYGVIRGQWKSEAAVFLGIPYAKPPVNDLQFKKPQKPNPWTDTLVANHSGARCLTLPTVDKEKASEDCLYLNIFSYSLKPKALLPVVVFVHGGSYETGSSDDISERGILKNFVNKGLVVVTFNYRLNFYGFFTTMTKDFPPNLGLWDQLHVLHWVRNEIHNFGGDPYHITLAGHGSGSSSVALHLHSPHSSGLFKRAIMMSGSTFCPFALTGNRYKIESSKIVAVSLRCCTGEDFDDRTFGSKTIDCLKTVDQGKVWQILHNNFSDGASHDVYQSPWAPVIDDDFLPKSMEIVSRDVQVLIGSTANEKGIAEISVLMSKSGQHLVNVTKDTFDLAVATLARPEAFPKSFRIVADLLKFAYGFQTKIEVVATDENWLDKKISMSSDYWMNSGVLKEAQMLAKRNNTVYLYSFDYVSTNFYDTLTHNLGAVHGMDLALLVPGNETLKSLGLHPWNFGKSDRQMQNILSTYWYNFIKTGNPNLPLDVSNRTWIPLNPDKEDTLSQFMSLTSDPRMKSMFAAKADHLWNWMIPRITDPMLVSSSESTLLNYDDVKNISTEKRNVYKIVAFILLAILIVIAFIYLISFLIYRRKLRSYHFLKRIEELNFS